MHACALEIISDDKDGSGSQWILIINRAFHPDRSRKKQLAEYSRKSYPTAGDTRVRISIIWESLPIYLLTKTPILFNSVDWLIWPAGYSRHIVGFQANFTHS